MNEIKFFNSPLNIIFLFLFISLVNLVLTVHFFTIFFAGIVFLAFIQCIETKSLYSLVFLVFTFIFIEVSHGLYIGSLSLVVLFIYIFIKPKIQYTLSSRFLFIFSLVGIFYFLFFILFYFNANINIDLVYKFLFNYILDIIVIAISFM
jgi:hypothetical protein